MGSVHINRKQKHSWLGWNRTTSSGAAFVTTPHKTRHSEMFCLVGALLGGGNLLLKDFQANTPWKSTNVSFFCLFFCGDPCFTFATRFPQLSKTISYLMLMIMFPSNYTTKISTGRQLIVKFISSNTVYRHASCVRTTPGPLMGGTSNQGWQWFRTGCQQRSWSMNLGPSVEPKCAMVQSESRLELPHKEAWHSAPSCKSSCG
jgi:hypothetical protein